MGQAEQQILQMLSDGIISAEEARNLLEALDSENAQPPPYPDGADQSDALEGEVITPYSSGPPPELGRYRRFWLIPFLLAVGTVLLSGLGIYLLLNSENPAILGFFCFGGIFFAGLLAALILLLAQRSTWLYLNIEERGGSRIRFALPLPLSFFNWVVRLARPFVPHDQFMLLQTAGSMVNIMQNDPNREPIEIDVDDESGNKVQIYIG